MIKFYQVKRSKAIIDNINKQKTPLLFHRYWHVASPIPSIQQMIERTKYMDSLHKWKKQSKVKKLQETYDENIRIFMNLSKQKSNLDFGSKKPERKSRSIRLVPLSERLKTENLHNKGNKTQR